MKAGKLPNESKEDEHCDTNEYLLLEPYENKK